MASCCEHVTVPAPEAGFAASSDDAIETDRLALELLRPEALRALLAHDVRRASECQDLVLPRDFLPESGADGAFLAFHHQQLRDHPEVRGWSIRAMVRRSDGAVVGNCGFHGPPRAVGRAEIGYAVLPPYRGDGFATEAARALVHWAFERGEHTVVAGVASTNAPSLAVVRRVGFVQTGAQPADDGDEELIFEIRKAAGDP